MTTNSDRARDDLIREHQQRTAVKLARQLATCGREAGLTDEEILASVANEQVRRVAERTLDLRKRSDTTWAFVAAMLPGALLVINPDYDPFARINA